MACGIYKIENQVNQKVYIGQSTNITTRWRRHRSEASNLNNSYPLYCAMRKYGLDNFSFEINTSFNNLLDTRNVTRESRDY